MNGICRVAPWAVSLRNAGKRSTSAWGTVICSMLTLKHSFQTWHQREDYAFRAYAHFGCAMHAIVVGMPATLGVKCAGWYLCLHNDLRALQRHGIGNVLPQKTAHFMRADDFVADGSKREALIGIAKPRQLQSYWTPLGEEGAILSREDGQD